MIEKDKDNSFLRIGSLRIGSLLGVNHKIPSQLHHQMRTSTPPTSLERMMHKSWGSADNVPSTVSYKCHKETKEATEFFNKLI